MVVDGVVLESRLVENVGITIKAVTIHEEIV